MRCNEIQERFVDLLYHEQGTPSASEELQAHIRSCPACQKELAEFKDLQATLKVWQDEPPLRPVTIPRPERAHTRIGLRLPIWHLVRYAAFAALVALAFLGLSNASIQWDRNGFAFRTNLLSKVIPAPLSPSDSYTKEQVDTIIRRVMDQSRAEDLWMGQKVLETIDQERATEYQRITRQIKESRSKN